MYTFPVPAGKHGYITFSAKRYYINGWLKYYLNGQFMQQKWISGSTAVSLPNGELEGIITIKIENF